MALPHPEATEQVRIPRRADRQHALNSMKALEGVLDQMAKDLSMHIKGKAQSPKQGNDIRILGVLHKASSYIYCAHATFLEIKPS